MADPTPEPVASDLSTRFVEHRRDFVWTGIVLGVLLAAVGVVDGIVMAARRKVVTCADGTYFPEGATDLNCYAHPQGALGVAVATSSALLGILVVFAGVVVLATLRDRPAASGEKPSST